MTMKLKMRRFTIDNGRAVISKDGDFLHINDVILLIINERMDKQSMINVLPQPEESDDWPVKSKFAYEKQIELLNELEQHIIKND